MVAIRQLGVSTIPEPPAPRVVSAITPAYAGGARTARGWWRSFLHRLAGKIQCEEPGQDLGIVWVVVPAVGAEDRLVQSLVRVD